MDISASPLVQQERPTFQPKIVSLYEELFQDTGSEAVEADKSDGFWTEFFLLKSHPAGLKVILEKLSGDDLLHLQPQTRQLFTRAVACLKKGKSPSDEIALDTLSAFLNEVLWKQYTNRSSDAIAVLAGLDKIDAVFTDFVNTLEIYIKSGKTAELRYKAVHVALVTACGAFHTGLLSYFTHRDLFPALMKFVSDPATSSRAFEPFVLLGVLANYNKFEFQNPYQLRLSDFVNEASIRQIVYTIGAASTQCRQDYINIQDDLPEGWTFGNMLSFVGLGGILGIGKRPPPIATASTKDPTTDPEVQKTSFAELPGSKAAILLATYDFVNANKLFSFTLISSRPTAPSNPSTPTAKIEPPFAAYLSLTSYLTHHAHRSQRSTLYAKLNLLVLRLLTEDVGICKRLASDELKTEVRLCRQRQPYLPIEKGDRTLLAAVLDIVIDGINHNLRKRLDVELYALFLGILLRMISFLVRSRIRLAFHWSELWRSLLSLLRFFTSYASDLSSLPRMSHLLDTLVNLIALSLSSGDAFLPSPAEYDDLFYKLVETGDVLVKFRSEYSSTLSSSNSIATLVSVSEHYYTLIDGEKGKRGGRNLTPGQVAEVIKNGYETLAIAGAGGVGVAGKDGLGEWERYREADERVFLKKVGRVVVVDARTLIDQEQI